MNMGFNPGGGGGIAGATDVALSSVQDNESLTYDNASSKWVNETVAGGVPTTRSIDPGVGLSGGGDLSQDRELAIDFAADGESSAAKAVRANDSRLTAAAAMTPPAGTRASFDFYSTDKAVARPGGADSAYAIVWVTTYPDKPDNFIDGDRQWEVEQPLAGINGVSMLAQGSTTMDAASFNTTSMTPTAQRTLCLCLAAGSGNTNLPNSVSGLGLTWTLVSGVEQGYSSAAVYRANAGSSPATGSVSIGYPNTINSFHWYMVEVDGANTSSPVAQTATYNPSTTETNPAFSLSSAPAANGRGLLFGSVNSDTVTLTPGSGSTQVGTQESTATSALRSLVTWYNPAQQNVGFSTTATAPRKSAVCLELRP